LFQEYSKVVRMYTVKNNGFGLFQKLFILILILGSTKCSTSPNNQNSVLEVIEAAYYLDNSPISIEIENGFIRSINRPKKFENDEQTRIYVAPGFIDHQVNGYLSYSFSRDGLDVDKVKEITQAFWKKRDHYLPPHLNIQ